MPLFSQNTPFDQDVGKILIEQIIFEYVMVYYFVIDASFDVNSVCSG